MGRFAVRHIGAASTLAVAALAAAAVACGVAAVPGAGKNNLMQGTFAGQNKCNPANHNRPFIIEWDATDMSSFQAHAADDVVLVKYAGCDLQVLEGCRDDSVKGAFGSYKPVQRTSGSMEVIDIADEGELYAKLPLGAASLDGKVQGGEKLHMEYYVSGTRTATRDAVYRGELAKHPSCAEATHFVYAYNLGAFALGEASKLHGQVNGSYFGFGAGGAGTSSSSAEKKGGVLSACTLDTAKETEDCKVPIRLTLRAISDGESPDARAARAPETDDARNLAGRLQARDDAERQAAQHADAALVKLRARDGAGCVAELDRHDQLDPRPNGLSTSATAGDIPLVRAKCVMLAGQCDAGRDLYRRARSTTWQQKTQDLDNDVDVMTGVYCQGRSLSDREQYLVAYIQMYGAWTTEPGARRMDAAACAEDTATLLRLRDKVPPTPGNPLIVDSRALLMLLQMSAPKCFIDVGDCAGAARAYTQVKAAQGYRVTAADVRDGFYAEYTGMFWQDASAQQCKGKL